LISSQIEQSDLKILIGKLEIFSVTIKQKLEKVDWQDKRDIFETLIKQVEIGRENVNIIFRVSPYPSKNNSPNLLEDCRVSSNSSVSNFHDKDPYLKSLIVCVT